MSREDVLLKEYELCQTENDTSAANYWTVSGIFIGISTALLAAIAIGLISAKDINEWILFVLIFIFGLSVFSFHAVMHIWLKRVIFLLRINHHRMREIENELGMRKSHLVWGLDNWDDIPIDFRYSILNSWHHIPGEKRIFYANKPKYRLPDLLRAPEVGRNVIPWFFIINSILWGIMIVLSFFIAIIDSIIGIVKLLV